MGNPSASLTDLRFGLELSKFEGVAGRGLDLMKKFAAAQFYELSGGVTVDESEAMVNGFALLANRRASQIKVQMEEDRHSRSRERRSTRERHKSECRQRPKDKHRAENRHRSEDRQTSRRNSVLNFLSSKFGSNTAVNNEAENVVNGLTVLANKQKKFQGTNCTRRQFVDHYRYSDYAGRNFNSCLSITHHIFFCLLIHPSGSSIPRRWGLHKKTPHLHPTSRTNEN